MQYMFFTFIKKNFVSYCRFFVFRSRAKSDYHTVITNFFVFVFAHSFILSRASKMFCAAFVNSEMAFLLRFYTGSFNLNLVDQVTSYSLFFGRSSRFMTYLCESKKLTEKGRF